MAVCVSGTMPKTASIRDRIVELRRVRAGDLAANPRNFRTHPKAQQEAMRGVLAEIGYAGASLARIGADGSLILLDGHLRRDVAPDAVVPVLVTDLDEAEGDYLLATYDPLSAMAGKDDELLAALLDGVRTDDEAVRAMLADLAGNPPLAGQTDPDDVPPVSEEPTTRPGDLWLLGEHRLLCGDSTERAELDRLMNGQKSDLVFTDPPYGVNVKGKGGNAIAGDISFTAIPLMFDVLDRVMAPGAWAYICGGQSNLLLYARMFERYFRQLPQMIVWDKGRTAVMRHNGYHSCYEIVYYAFREGGGGRWYGGRKSDNADDIWRIPVDADKDREHVTQKPVALAERAIENSSQSGQIVFDPFLGSGTTLIACERLGRRAYCLEIEPRYVDVAVRRWEQFTGKTAVLDGG